MKSSDIKTGETYPQFFKKKTGLVAIVARDKMYLVTNQGRNTNAGLCIDHYITRKMVLQHIGHISEKISEVEFMRLYNQLFSTALQNIIP